MSSKKCSENQVCIQTIEDPERNSEERRNGWSFAWDIPLHKVVCKSRTHEANPDRCDKVLVKMTMIK